MDRIYAFIYFKYFSMPIFNIAILKMELKN